MVLLILGTIVITRLLAGSAGRRTTPWGIPDSGNGGYYTIAMHRGHQRVRRASPAVWALRTLTLLRPADADRHSWKTREQGRPTGLTA
jgi:hypothetical protein